LPYWLKICSLIVKGNKSKIIASFPWIISFVYAFIRNKSKSFSINHLQKQTKKNLLLWSRMAPEIEKFEFSLHRKMSNQSMMQGGKYVKVLWTYGFNYHQHLVCLWLTRFDKSFFKCALCLNFYKKIWNNYCGF